MTDRATILGQLAADADAAADELLARAAGAVRGEQGITPRRNAFADALAMLDIADALRDRVNVEATRAAGTPA